MTWLNSIRSFASVVPALVFGFISAAICCAPASAEVLARSEGVSITTEDVLQDLERLPSELRSGILASPDKVRQVSTNLLVRRVLAQRAHEAALDKSPSVIAAVKLADDKVLSDAYLSKSASDALAVIDAKQLEKQARSYYVAEGKEFAHAEERQVRHILIGKAVEHQDDRAREVLAKLKDGADFAELAKEYSDDPSTKRKGGNLGFFGRGRMVDAFEQAAFGMTKIGEVSGPIETPFGLHILRLEAIRAAGKTPYEEVSSDIKDKLREKISSERRISLATPIRQSIEYETSAIESLAKQHQ